MFRDDKQRGLACQALTAQIPKGPWWAPNEEEHGDDTPRPTEAACHVIGIGLEGTEPPVLSASEETLVRVAWDFWNGQGDATIGRITMNLDATTQEGIADLLRASVRGPGSIDVWIDREERRRKVADGYAIYKAGLDKRPVF